MYDLVRRKCRYTHSSIYILEKPSQPINISGKIIFFLEVQENIHVALGCLKARLLKL